MNENIFDNLKQCDIAIIGMGAAGLQSAIHVARRNVSVFVFGKKEDSALFKAEVENYFGYDEKIFGLDLLNKGESLAKKFGAEFFYQSIISVKFDNDKKEFILETENYEKFLAKSIVIATGVNRKKLNVKGEKEYIGKGVSYCVDCDGMFFRNKVVSVVGNESSAFLGALTLSTYAKKVNLIFKDLNVSEKLYNEVLSNEKIEIFKSEEITEIKGDENFVKKLELKSGNFIETAGIFIELGSKSAIELFSFSELSLDLDENFKHIKVNALQETNIKGIFAAGDICGLPYQVAKAVGEGCIAGIRAVDFVKNDKL